MNNLKHKQSCSTISIIMTSSSSSSHKFLSCKIMIPLIFCFSFFLRPTESAAVTATRPAISASSTTAAQLLSAHNAVRARHYIPPLKWSNKLANYAKWYANQRRNDCALVHSSADYGENIFWGQGSRWKTTDAVASWAAQEAYYNYKKNTCMPNKDCLHYTQLVWRATTQVGCARIKCRSGDTYVVCEYYPHGNVIGERPY